MSMARKSCDWHDELTFRRFTTQQCLDSNNLRTITFFSRRPKRSTRLRGQTVRNRCSAAAAYPHRDHKHRLSNHCILRPLAVCRRSHIPVIGSSSRRRKPTSVRTVLISDIVRYPKLPVPRRSASLIAISWPRVRMPEFRRQLIARMDNGSSLMLWSKVPICTQHTT
jgi:hypothetical protein